ncbi:flagellar motor protein MotB [Methylomonas sp. SURF-2]|uniref:Flagellar motor protein MotB n=1 Tax=Methylomonas subterranea TaxID=2952225 RepID=A0ABT1TGA0_9GAMM|nr:flagellar motor protein MotB [Methylomonas sp. SURF-2]
MAESPVIIIKKSAKRSRHSRHGGVWKIAYADFVTAMMAFFLLMWLLGSTDDTTKKGISEYFQDPFGVNISTSGEGIADRAALIPGGGSDLAATDSGQVDSGPDIPPSLADKSPEEIEKLAELRERQILEKLEAKIESLLAANAKLAEYRDQIKLETTPEGLKIQIIDAQNRPMFKLASAEIEEHAKMILRELAPVINELPNKVTVNGHTDALPFPSNKFGYSNWELSSNRANIARHELNLGGLGEEKILRVVGLASSIPYNTENPEDPMNRRISVIVMNKKTENRVLHEGATPSEPAGTYEPLHNDPRTE